MKFHKQAKSEFGRTWAAPRGQAAALQAAATGGGGGGTSSSGEAGRAFASFYGSLVQTKGAGWVSGGTLQDGAVTESPAAGGPTLPSSSAPAPAAAAAAAQDAAEPSHAGLGSAAARAELQAEAAQLTYGAPAGPQPRGGQGGAAQGPADGAQQQQQQEQREAWAPRQGVRYGIARSNVGFQLLKKAGWREGAGLGAQEQGMAEPLAAFQQKGNLGLGFAPKPKPKPAAGTAPAAAAGGGGAAAQQQAAAQQRPKRPLPEDPLDKEDTDTKVKRVRQVMQAEADEKAGKAIARYIRMAFNDATGEPTRDANPLLRRNHKLSATNPLL